MRVKIYPIQREGKIIGFANGSDIEDMLYFSKSCVKNGIYAVRKYGSNIFEFSQKEYEKTAEGEIEFLNDYRRLKNLGRKVYHNTGWI